MRGRMDIVVAGAEGAPRFGQWCEFQGRLGDHGQGSLGANQQAGKVIADHALGRHASGAYRFATAGDRAQGKGVFARRTVFHCTRASRVVGKVAADGADRRARRIGWPEKTLFCSSILQLCICDPGFDRCHAVFTVDGENPVHALEGEHHGMIERNGCARSAGATATADERNAMAVADRDNGSDLFMGARKDHCAGRRLPAAVVIGVGPAVGGLRQQVVRTCCIRQCRESLRSEIRC